MTQMNLPVKHSHEYREQACDRQDGGGWGGVE